MNFKMIKNIAASIVVCSISLSAVAQIPNAGFENWTAATGYDDPNGWGTANSTTAALNVYTVEKETTNVNGGSAAIKLTSKFVSLPPVISLDVPGIAVTGNINVDIASQSFSIDGGFAYTNRPEKLVGFYQYAPQGADEFVIAGFFWKNNGGTIDTIGTFEFTDNGTVTTYTQFEALVDYRSTDTPDSARIVLSSSNPASAVAESELLVDDLSFVSLSVGIQKIDALINGIKVFPNPAKEFVNIEIADDAQHQLNVYDVNGKLVSEEIIANKTAINLNNNKGVHIYSIKNLTTGKVVSGKFIAE